MADHVTTAQLAAELETTPNRLARWLRDQRDAGHPLLAAIPPRSPFRFTRAQADQLAVEFEAAEGEGHVSDSAVQRRAEEVIRGLLAERLGVALEPRTIKLAIGAPVHVDAASPDGRVLAEIFARQGALKGGQQKKVAIDTLKLITVRRERPEVQKLIICFADQAAARYATGGGWLAQALLNLEGRCRDRRHRGRPARRNHRGPRGTNDGQPAWMTRPSALPPTFGGRRRF